MEARNRKVLRYDTSDGKAPFDEWLESLRDRKTRNKIKQRLDRVELGNLGTSKPVGNGVFELIINYGPGYRVYFGHSSLTVVILLCGGDKSNQQQDILKAKEYWADYESYKNTDEC